MAFCFLGIVSQVRVWVGNVNCGGERMILFQYWVRSGGLAPESQAVKAEAGGSLPCTGAGLFELHGECKAILGRHTHTHIHNG